MCSHKKNRKLGVATALLCLALCFGVLIVGKAEPSEKNIFGVSSVEELTQEEAWSWTPTANCTQCHSSKAESVNPISCLTTADGSIGCLPCHDNVSGLADAHKKLYDGNGPNMLKETEVDNDACEECHETGQLIGATASRMIRIDGEGKYANPHSLPDNAGHSRIACSNCHNPHNEESAKASAEKTCASCHPTGAYG